MLSLIDTRPATPGPADARPTLVLSHAFSFAKRDWVGVAGLLADQYRTVAVDLPGFGAAHWRAPFEVYAHVAAGGRPDCPRRRCPR